MVPQPKTMSQAALAFDETSSHPWASSSLSILSAADQSIDCPPRVVFDIFKKILYSNSAMFLTSTVAA